MYGAVDMTRLSGYSMIGRRCFGLCNFGEKKRTNVIGTLCAGSLPKLPEKSVFVIDNVSFHKHESIKNLLEQGRCHFYRLIPLSLIRLKKMGSGLFYPKVRIKH